MEVLADREQSATMPARDAVSLWISTPNSIPSRTLMMDTPWTPI
ncbi:hypothetical protein AB0387_29590 [Streptomyces sp. NPDC089173]